MIAVIAKLPVQPEKKEEAVTAAKDLIKEVANEEGTLYYTLNVDEKDPNTLIFMERYMDKAALGVHGATPHFQAFMEKAMAFAAGQPQIQVLQEIESI